MYPTKMNSMDIYTNEKDADGWSLPAHIRDLPIPKSALKAGTIDYIEQYLKDNFWHRWSIKAFMLEGYSVGWIDWYREPDKHIFTIRLKMEFEYMQAARKAAQEEYAGQEVTRR